MKKMLAVAVAATASPMAFAETPTQQEQLLVTASRSDQAIVHNLNSTTVFTREDIERLQVTSIQELLAKSPSVNIISNGGRGAATGLSLRGNQTDHTLFLIDGVRVGSATLGSTAVQFIDPELVERVEIVRGPKSSLYGTDALGGVVNIITRRATTALTSPLLIMKQMASTTPKPLFAPTVTTTVTNNNHWA
jgi:vitamin B12 transporter